MKKIIKSLTFMSIVFGALALGGCDNVSSHKIALITDSNGVNDSSYVHGTYEGIKSYLEPRGYHENDDFKYFCLEKDSTNYEKPIEEAINWGADAVICVGYYYENALWHVQNKYPNVKFMMQDGDPKNDEGVIDISDNTLAIHFKENESGFLAGYATVMDGKDNLGFLGGTFGKATSEFGIGYVAGAYYASSVKKIDISFTNNHYAYFDNFTPSADKVNLAQKWYKEDLDCIFAAAGGANYSVINAAEREMKWMVGVDVDQSYLSARVLTSAVKNFKHSVEIFLERVLYDGWNDDKSLELGIKENGVGIATSEEAWRFSTFKGEDYNSIFVKLKNDAVKIPTNYETLRSFVLENGKTLELTKNTVEPTNI